ncbi:AAA family ATPase [Actinoplanes subglobosus]|uniref:AAA family ATPase n=1 Tax=Actinoplanes subglobosus TaxID=1547892 RepID=A0ABV8J8I7_9ACTN
MASPFSAAHAHGPTLIILRGNSGSGKTTTAREVRRRYGRGCALIEQDQLRRVLLREHGGLGDEAIAPGFIVGTAKAALEAGYHVVLEGILHSGEHRTHLRQLIETHPGPASCYYMDVSFEETVRRHHQRAEPIPVTADMMHDWYTNKDLLGTPGERIIPETFTLEEAVTTILQTSGLTQATPRTPCPTSCHRCTQKTTTSPARMLNHRRQPTSVRE